MTPKKAAACWSAQFNEYSDGRRLIAAIRGAAPFLGTAHKIATCKLLPLTHATVVKRISTLRRCFFPQRLFHHILPDGKRASIHLKHELTIEVEEIADIKVALFGPVYWMFAICKRFILSRLQKMLFAIIFTALFRDFLENQIWKYDDCKWTPHIRNGTAYLMLTHSAFLYCAFFPMCFSLLARCTHYYRWWARTYKLGQAQLGYSVHNAALAWFFADVVSNANPQLGSHLGEIACLLSTSYFLSHRANTFTIEKSQPLSWYRTK